MSIKLQVWRSYLYSSKLKKECVCYYSKVREYGVLAWFSRHRCWDWMVDATLKDVREFVFQQLQCEQPSQATTSLSSGASRRSGRHIPFSGVSAAVSSDRCFPVPLF